jgi:hypothetical protein
MAQRETGRTSIEKGIRFINPPLEVVPSRQEAAQDWLDDPERDGHYVSEMTAEGDVRTAMFWVSDLTVWCAFKLEWCQEVVH